MPIESVEKYNSELTSIQEEKLNLEKDRSNIYQEKIRLQDSIDEYKVKVTVLQDLINQLKFESRDRDIDKFQDWQKKVEEAKVNEYRSRRRLIDLEEENKLLLNQATSRQNIINVLEEEISSQKTNQANFNIFKSRYESLVTEIQENLATQQKIATKTISLTSEAPQTLPLDLTERCETLVRESTVLRQNLIKLQEQNSNLQSEVKGFKEKLFSKDKEKIELEQTLGECKIRMQQMGVDCEEKDRNALNSKKNIVSNSIGGADIMLKLMQLEQRATQAEAKFESAQQEIKAKEVIIQRTEERLASLREERRRLETAHDEKLAELKKKINEDGAGLDTYLTLFLIQSLIIRLKEPFRFFKGK